MNRVEHIRSLLQSAFQPTELDVHDDSHLHAGHAGAAGGAGHYRVTLVAPAFAGKSRLDKHRMVYDALQTMIPQEIHALVIQARDANE